MAGKGKSKAGKTKTVYKTRYVKAKRRSGGKKKSLRWGYIGGIALGIWQGKKQYDTLRGSGLSVGRSVCIATTCIDPTNAPGTNSVANILSRAANSWPAPVGAGVAISEVAGNARGAMGSGFGLKLNKHLPRWGRL